MPPERLTTRILHPHDPSPSAEDIFSSALETLFTDDTQQSHGVPGQSVIYRSPRFGDVYLQIPVHPDQDVGRRLFAHYLWNAGVVVAEGIERASCEGVGTEGQDADGGALGGRMRWDGRFWDVRGLDVLELGAATALPSLISALSNARTVVSTDHPSSPAITMNAIETNIKINVTNRGTAMRDLKQTKDATEREYVNDKMPVLNHPSVHTDTKTVVCGYTWGTEEFYNPQEDGKLAEEQPALRSFDRLVVADCLWMPDQHENIVKTILLYLKDNKLHNDQGCPTDSRIPCAIVVAGFHTGREVVNRFIQIATGSISGDDTGNGNTQAKLEAIEICEIDIDGNRRPWQDVRPTETKEQSKRWCMCAILARR